MRKILLFKDMKQSDARCETDATLAVNQQFVKDTIASYSSDISLPSRIIKKSLRLNSYFLGEGVC